MRLLEIPLEILEQILILCDPLDVSSTAQTCRVFRALVYPETGHHLWQSLFLAQPFDDPRRCVDSLGRPLDMSTFDWRAELQRRITTRTVLTKFTAWSSAHDGVQKSTILTSEQRCAALRTVMHVVSNIPVVHSLSGDELSENLAWAAAMLHHGILDAKHHECVPSDEEAQLTARLHTLFGITPRDMRPAARVYTRAYVYDMRRYKWESDYGPFLPASPEHLEGTSPAIDVITEMLPLRVNWVHIRAIHHVMSMHIVPDAVAEAEDFDFTIFPMSLPYCQTICEPGVDLDAETDWAGIEGDWRCSFCFCDHRELLLYNNFNMSDSDDRDPSIFENPDFVEMFRSINVKMQVRRTTPDPAYPTRPIIDFVGIIDGHMSMSGSVRMGEDDIVRWRFASGEPGQATWSSEGVQIGGIRSAYGVLGAWTTVFHDNHDPVGPFWLKKLNAGDVS